MIRSLWAAVRSSFGGDDGDDEADRGRFVPSPLDLSVRAAHGGSDGEVERELRDIDERARELEATRDR